ncbi:hypothetical protein [Cryobacterium sp. GrIS_2_6]|uniref:hypothetical protein n=1 Tax=Cryobacterium sp. GrIS_2_6 TaxID=3162785 RepID=UPI002E10DFF0
MPDQAVHCRSPSPEDIESATFEIETNGHFASHSSSDKDTCLRSRHFLTGTITLDAAQAEIFAKKQPVGRLGQLIARWLRGVAALPGRRGVGR